MTTAANPGDAKPNGYGYGTWERWGQGRFIVDANAGAAEQTSGAATATPAGTVSQPTFTGDALGTHSHGAGTLATSAHAGTAVADHASHTHSYTDVIQHTHTVSITDPGHNHTQNPHSHGMAEGQTDGAGNFADRSNAASPATMVTDSATATNNANTTGITASTANPAGSVASGTTAGPSATLAHSITQPADHTMSGSTQAVGAGTPSGTVSQPTFTGQAMSIIPPSISAFFWKRTA